MVALIAANSRLLPGGVRRRPPVLALPRGALRARDQCATLVRARAVCMNSNRNDQPGVPWLGTNLLACGLCKKSRTREPSFRGRFIDLIDQSFVERDIDTHRSPGIGKQRNSEQNGACFNSSNNIFVAKHVIGGTRRCHPPACTLDCLDMLTKSHSRIRHSFVHRLSSRETPLDVGKPDAEGAVRLFFNDSYIVHRHSVDTPPRTRGSG